MAALMLYGREYCDLCRIMRHQLQAITDEKDLQIGWFDIDDDAEVEAKYDTMVPVLVGKAGEVICFYHLDYSALDAYLRRIQ